MLSFCQRRKVFCLVYNLIFFGGDIVTDSQEAVHLLKTHDFNLDFNCYLTEDIKAMLSTYVNFNVSDSSTSTNTVAHVVAQFAVG